MVRTKTRVPKSKLFENAAIRSAILAFHRFLKQHKSHRVEVAALGDPRSNGDSTLKSTIRDAFPLRELRASQQTGDIAPLSTPSASDISRHDRSCLYFDFKNQNAVLDIDFNIYGKYYRPRSHRVEVAASRDPRANGGSTLKFANQTKSITVGLLFAPENTTSVSADTGVRVLPILPVFASSNRL
ncbi:hypothetical protein V1477_012138 [Vespula maculifrons]|uniref:Uncharacterized protein n=1 Tax=Vespula maculifrons TaxID=7453 RepID=A0ABD2BWN2_VESMC